MNPESHSQKSDTDLPSAGVMPSFVGREKEFADLQRLLSEHRLVTLKGTGGIGKTRFARELMARPNKLSHITNLAFASLEHAAQDTAEAVCDVLASQLKLDIVSHGNAREALVANFQSASTLLVVDNCETSPLTLPVLILDLINRCPGLRVLATSQRQLGVQNIEAVYDLPCLLVPTQPVASGSLLESFDGFRLFAARAALVDTGWKLAESDTPALCKVLSLSDGIPLAIEIIAAWVPFISLDQVARELEETPLGKITAFSGESHVQSERHRSLYRCLEWSFGHLQEPEKELFQKIGIFAGAFTEEATRSVCALEHPMPLLVRLAKASLIQPIRDTTPRRYSTLHFTRVFARDKAQAIGIAQGLVARHVDFFFNLASPLNSEGERISDASPSFEHDWPDMLAAAEAALNLPDKLPAAWEISRALGPFLMRIGLWSERENLTRAAVEAAERAGNWAALERSLVNLGEIREARGDWQAAEESYRRSLYFANRNANPDAGRQATALQKLGTVLRKLGRTEDAERARAKLEEIASQMERQKAKARSLYGVAEMHYRCGQLDKAEAKHREALVICEAIGDEVGIAWSQSRLGVVLTRKGAWEAAETYLRKSLSFWQTRGEAKGQAVILGLLGDLFRRHRQFPVAEDYYRKALVCQTRDRKGRAVTLSNLGITLRAQHRMDDAVIAFRESLEVGRSLNDVEGQSIALDELGITFSIQQLWDDALHMFEASCQLKKSAQHVDAVGLAITLDHIAQLHTRRKSWAEAKAAYEESIRLSRNAGRHRAAAVRLMNYALMNAAQGAKADALRLLDESISSLGNETTGGWLLVSEATKLSKRLQRKMREGEPWDQWRDAEYLDQHFEIRNKYARRRKGGLWQQAAEAYADLAQDFMESGHLMESAIALNELGSVCRHLRAFYKSEETIRQALSLFTQIELPIGQAASWHKLGDLFAAQHQCQNAKEAYTESIKLKRKCSDDDGEAISQDALAVLLINVGQFADAERAANRSWEIMSESGSARQKWRPLICLLWIKVEQSDLTGAQAVSAGLVEAVRGNPELEAAAGELRAMTEAGNWAGIKSHLARAGITGPAEIPAPALAVQEPREVSAGQCSLHRRGQGWEICFKGSCPFQLKDTVGVRYLATLLESHGKSIHCSLLASSKGRAVVSGNLTAENTPALTSKTKLAYRARLRELEEQIATAESRGQVDEVVTLKEEAAGITAALEAAHDKHGDDQSLAADGDRVRNAVCNPIRRVMNSLRDDPHTRKIGLYLIEQVSLGYTCVYPKDPEQGLQWSVEL